MPGRKEKTAQSECLLTMEWHKIWQLQHGQSVVECFLRGKDPARWALFQSRTDFYPLPSCKTEGMAWVRVGNVLVPARACAYGNVLLILSQLCVDKGQALVSSLEHFWRSHKNATTAPNALSMLLYFSMYCSKFWKHICSRLQVWWAPSFLFRALYCALWWRQFEKRKGHLLWCPMKCNHQCGSARMELIWGTAGMGGEYQGGTCYRTRSAT